MARQYKIARLGHRPLCVHISCYTPIIKSLLEIAIARGVTKALAVD